MRGARYKFALLEFAKELLADVFLFSDATDALLTAYFSFNPKIYRFDDSTLQLTVVISLVYDNVYLVFFIYTSAIILTLLSFYLYS